MHACVNAIALAIAAENASSSGGSVKKDHGAHAPAKVPTYLSERTAAAAIAGATKDFLLPCGPKFS